MKKILEIKVLRVPALEIACKRLKIDYRRLLGEYIRVVGEKLGYEVELKYERKPRVLSERDSLVFGELLTSREAPNKALKLAAKLYNRNQRAAKRK